jgi:saposin
MTLPPDNDDVCAVCKEMVKEARDQLLSNMTQDELRQVLEGSCALIPLKIVAKECSTLMDNFIPELVDALASRMDPQQVCAVSGLCNSARIDALLENRLNCSNCKYYINKAIGYLNKGDERLRDVLFQECGHLGSYSDSCRAAVTEEFEAIRRALSRADAQEFCQFVGICTEVSGDGGEEVVVYKPKEDLGCDFCKQLVSLC